MVATLSFVPIDIRLDDEFGQWLTTEAERLVITPNTLIRRRFGLSDVADGRLPDTARSAPVSAGGPPPRDGRRAPSGVLLKEESYEVPILRALVAAGGRAPAQTVIDDVGYRLAGHLTALDHDRLASGEVRWRNRTQFARLKLVQRGLLDRTAPRGIWSITEAGRRWLSVTDAGVQRPPGTP